jgi:hypothetical protein
MISARLGVAIMATALVVTLSLEASGGGAVDTSIADDILWVEVALADAAADKVVIKILTPTDDEGRRSLWQKCVFASSGPGVYRCGIDVSQGSAARNASGEWVGRGLVDGTRVGRVLFHTS